MKLCHFIKIKVGIKQKKYLKSLKNWKKQLKIDQLILQRFMLKGVIIFKKILLEKIGMEYGL